LDVKQDGLLDFKEFSSQMIITKTFDLNFYLTKLKETVEKRFFKVVDDILKEINVKDPTTRLDLKALESCIQRLMPG